MVDSKEYSKNKHKLINKSSYEWCKKNYDSEDEVMGFSSEECYDGDQENKDSLIPDIKDFENFNLPNEKAWGKKKKSYYSTDYIDADYSSISQKEIDGAELEEKEARNLQNQLVQHLNETDFGIDLILKYNKFNDGNEYIKIDLTQLSRRQKEELIRKESPELILMITDFCDRLLEAKMILCQFLNLLKTVNYKDYFIINFIKTKYNLLLHYCTNISFYLMLKAKKQIISIHPVIKRLGQYRKLLSQIDKCKENTFNQIKIQFNKMDFVINQIQIKKKTERQIEHKNIANNKLNSSSKNLGSQNLIIDIDKRAITPQIVKNKGLTPHRKKEQRNPRVKHRNKYRQAKINRKGAIREIRKENNKYKGEMSGIKTNIKKSIKLK